MAEITLDIRDVKLRELAVEQSSDTDKVTFSIDGHVTGVEEGKVKELMQAQRVTPVTLVVETE